MGVWRVAQRGGEAAERYSDALSQYHGDSRSAGAPTDQAPGCVVLSVDGCLWGMQVRKKRGRRVGAEKLPPAACREGRPFPGGQDRSPAAAPGARRDLAGTPLSGAPVSGELSGDADAIFSRLYAQLRELGWLGPDTVVVIVGDGAEWIWNRNRVCPPL